MGERARLVDLEARLRHPRALSSLAILIALLAAGPYVGFWPLVPFAGAIVVLTIVDRRVPTAERPERLVMGGILVVFVAAACGPLLTGGVSSPLLPLIIVPTISMAVRFGRCGLLVGLAVGISSVTGACLAVSPGELVANPAPAFVVLATLGTIAVVAEAMRRVEIEHREESTLDPLTGLLNRRALGRRFEEVAEQARLTDLPVSVVAIDLDRFKAVNDEHGHAIGDAVLRDVAYALRRDLRSFELLYRLGGEELLLLLPGATTEAALRMAEGMRRAVEESRPAGIAVTASFGVASALGAEVEPEQLMAAADTALYAAKRDGRNRVRAVAALALA